MNQIESFKVDHRTLTPGVYVSRVDGDITTYDMRVVTPNTEPLLTNSELHSFEHMFATLIRNSAINRNVIYFGPMGCQTGFYLCVRNADNEEVAGVIQSVLREILAWDGEVFGKSEEECGNYQNLRLDAAKRVAETMLKNRKGIKTYQSF